MERKIRGRGMESEKSGDEEMYRGIEVKNKRCREVAKRWERREVETKRRNGEGDKNWRSGH